MLYLIDANVIIDAKDRYYQIDRVPEYWQWLIHRARSGSLKIPFEIFSFLNKTQKSNLKDELK